MPNSRTRRFQQLCLWETSEDTLIGRPRARVGGCRFGTWGMGCAHTHCRRGPRVLLLLHGLCFIPHPQQVPPEVSLCGWPRQGHWASSLSLGIHSLLGCLILQWREETLVTRCGEGNA